MGRGKRAKRGAGRVARHADALIDLQNARALAGRLAAHGIPWEFVELLSNARRRAELAEARAAHLERTEQIAVAAARALQRAFNLSEEWRLAKDAGPTDPDQCPF